MLLLALLVASNLGPLPATGPLPAAELAQLRVQLTETLNAHRAQNGLLPLDRDPTAEEAAQFQADDMLAHDKMQHLDSSGRGPLDRYMGYGGKADYYGENVGFRAPAVLDPVLLWQVLAKLDGAMMAEVPPNDGHRRNILSEHFSEVGIGIAVGPNGVFMAEDFVGYLKLPESSK